MTHALIPIVPSGFRQLTCLSITSFQAHQVELGDPCNNIAICIRITCMRGGTRDPISSTQFSRTTSTTNSELMHKDNIHCDCLTVAAYSGPLYITGGLETSSDGYIYVYVLKIWHAKSVGRFMTLLTISGHIWLYSHDMKRQRIAETSPHGSLANLRTYLGFSWTGGSVLETSHCMGL